jgi:glycosyltransferase involved in cell wall biosynthesis
MRGRVLHVLSSDQRRGAESFGVRLHEQLTGRGWSSGVVCLAGSGDQEALPVPALGRRRYAPRGLIALRHKAKQYDVVVAHGSSTLAACALALAATRVPFVYVNIGDPRFWWRGRTRRTRVRLLLRRAAAVATISETARRILVDEIGLPPGAVVIIPNGRPADAFPAADPARRAAARVRLGLDPDAVVLAWVGALSREKRPELAVEVVARVPAADLVMAGDGPQRTAVTRLAARAAPGRVHLLGRTDRVADVLTAADVALVTSESEGLPGVLVEAGLVGIPAVTTDVGWVRDVVLDGVTGRVVPSGRADLLADAVRAVLPAAAAMGDAARRHCLERFEMGRVVDRWEDLLADVRPAVGMTARTPGG